MHSCSASSGLPDSNSPDCIVFFLLCGVAWWKEVEWWRIYFSGAWCIYIMWLFAAADILLAADISALPWYPLSQMLFSWPTYLQLALLWTCRCFSACLTCTIASTSCFFWDLKILPSQILHLHHTFSITCGCSSSKFCIFNLLFLYLADTLQ